LANALGHSLSGLTITTDGPEDRVPLQYANLLVQFEQLREEYNHLIVHHWLPLQRLASGAVSLLYAFAGKDPNSKSPSLCGECNACHGMMEPSFPLGSRDPPPTPNSLPDLISLSSSLSDDPSPIPGRFGSYLFRGVVWLDADGDAGCTEAGGCPSLHLFAESPGLGSDTAFEDVDQALLEGADGGVQSGVDLGSNGGGDAVDGSGCGA